MDMISILKADHREVEALFDRVEAASDRAVKLKQKLFDKIKTALTVHAAAEEKILYPCMRELRLLHLSSFVAGEEHRLVKQLLAEISELGVGDELWDAKVKVLMEMVRHHVQQEETEYFTVLRSELQRSELRQLGELIQSFKDSFQTPLVVRPAPLAAGTSAQLQT